MAWDFIDYSMITKGVDSVTGKRYVFLMADPALGAYSVNLATGNLDFEYRGPEHLDISHGNHDGICDPASHASAPHADLMEDSDGKQYMVTPRGNEEPCELDLVTYSISKGIRLTDPETTGGGPPPRAEPRQLRHQLAVVSHRLRQNAPYCVSPSTATRSAHPPTRSAFPHDPHREQIW